MTTNVKDFILASGSPQRIALLRQIAYEPKKIVPADICEDCLPHEDPLPYVRRMAIEKARKIAEEYPNENILACDTIVVVGKKVLHKAKNEEEQAKVMNLLSGKTHRVISSVCLINKQGKISQKTISSKISMKTLTPDEIKNYVKSDEWHGVCGYRIDGAIAAYVSRILGSYSGIIGLPLYETLNLLKGENIR